MNFFCNINRTFSSVSKSNTNPLLTLLKEKIGATDIVYQLFEREFERVENDLIKAENNLSLMSNRGIIGKLNFLEPDIFIEAMQIHFKSVHPRGKSFERILNENPGFRKKLNECFNENEKKVTPEMLNEIYKELSRQIHIFTIPLRVPDCGYLSDEENCLMKKIIEYMKLESVDLDQVRINYIGAKAAYEDWLIYQGEMDQDGNLIEEEDFKEPLTKEKM